METDNLHNERVIIETILHSMICSIDELNVPQSKKEQMKEETFKKFLEIVCNDNGCPAFSTMSVEQLKKEYKKFIDSLNMER